jgi:transcriptional regulator with XRE-family HTH domain
MRSRMLFCRYVMTRLSSLWSRPLPGPTAKKDPEGGRSFALTLNLVKGFLWFHNVHTMHICQAPCYSFLMPQPRKQPLPPLSVELEAVALRIKRLRKIRGLTQKELADHIGITRDILASYESGRAHLNDDTIIRFAIALQVSADELLGLKDHYALVGQTPNVRLIKRMQKIQELPTLEQKALLKNIDMFLKASADSDR